jgi:hypothetical protein
MTAVSPATSEACSTQLRAERDEAKRAAEEALHGEEEAPAELTAETLFKKSGE